MSILSGTKHMIIRSFCLKTYYFLDYKDIKTAVTSHIKSTEKVPYRRFFTIHENSNKVLMLYLS